MGMKVDVVPVWEQVPWLSKEGKYSCCDPEMNQDGVKSDAFTHVKHFQREVGILMQYLCRTDSLKSESLGS